jgi:hypothetical protein
MALKPEISNELRGMVREVLREVAAQRSPPVLAAVEAVRLVTDQQLQAFVQRITEPAMAEKVRKGAIRFALAAGTTQATPVVAAAVPGALTGVITEQKIDRLAAAGTLVLGPGAVLTPLARDRARRLGLKIERRS